MKFGEFLITEAAKLSTFDIIKRKFDKRKPKSYLFKHFDLRKVSESDDSLVYDIFHFDGLNGNDGNGQNIASVISAIRSNAGHEYNSDEETNKTTHEDGITIKTSTKKDGNMYVTRCEILKDK